MLRKFCPKTGRKRRHGKPGLKWEDNVRMNRKETKREGANWINLA